MNDRSNIEQFATEDFKNLYRQIKCLNLLNQLYDSDAITREEFQEEEREIIQRFKRLERHLGDHDLNSFAKLYNIEKDYNRIKKQDLHQSTRDRELQSICLTLGSKFPQIQDTIHTSKETREVGSVINVLSEMVILLNKYMKLAKRVSPDLKQLIEKINQIFQTSRKKNIHEQFTPIEYFQLEDIISKLILEFSNIE